jgi:hypothetical protein
MKDKSFTPIIILCSVIIMLVGLSYVNLSSFKWVKLKNVNLFSDITKRKLGKPLPLPYVEVDSTKINGKYVQPTDITLIADYGLDGDHSIIHFFQKLNAIKTQKKKLRIAYFGDSYIEGDYITGELRAKFQESYGGNGIGFIPMQSIVENNYANINFSSNNSWSDQNFVNSPQSSNLGLTGHVFYSKGASGTTYSPKNGNRFNQVKLYTGSNASGPSNITVTKDNLSGQLMLNNNEIINETLISGSPISGLKIDIGDSQLPVYGISVEDSTGIYLDNYAFRGNSGQHTNKVSPAIMSGFGKYLQYDLIILHYGLNAVAHGQEKFTWYENALHKLIEKMKTAYPNTAILLISTSDMGFNQDGNWVTEPAVPFMVSTQRGIAKKNKVAFWDLYTSMGGENTIVSWAEQDPKLAAMDYTHLSYLGAKKVATLIYNKIMASKSHYENNRVK